MYRRIIALIPLGPWLVVLGCGANPSSPACQGTVNNCMEQCANDPQPADRQEGFVRDTRTACEQRCSGCDLPKTTPEPPPPGGPLGTPAYQPSPSVTPPVAPDTDTGQPEKPSL